MKAGTPKHIICSVFTDVIETRVHYYCYVRFQLTIENEKMQ